MDGLFYNTRLYWAIYRNELAFQILIQEGLLSLE